MDNKLKDGEKIQASPLPKQEIGIDTDSTLADSIVSAYESSSLSAADIERFSTISQSRETVYQLIDTMGRDSDISAVLETYAEDTTETNESGDIVWVESKDGNAASYCNYLLNLMNINKNIYAWAISLIKYGDVYVRLYRESDFIDDKPKESAKKVLQENIIKKDLREDVNIIIHNKNDNYVSYVEMVDNPAEMFELTRFGKTVGYVKAPTRVFRSTSPLDTSAYLNQFYNYNFNEGDVEVYPADDFVHAKLEDTTPRAVETVSFDFNDGKNTKTKYKVVRGQSILANAFKIWRLLSLLENSVVLSRVTKSSIIRVLQLEIGDMDKQSAQRKLVEIKQNIEQKTALHENESMGEYNNPGPVENTIYLTTHGGVGALTAQTLGGDVDPKQLTDLSYFQDKLYGAFRVPKQYFGHTEDGAGFNGGASLSIISSRYGKSIKRVQNALCQMITDLLNLKLIDKGYTNYVNNFVVRMKAPVTQEEIDARAAQSENIRNVQDILNTLSDVTTPATRIELSKALLTPYVNSDVISILEKEYNRLKKEEENNPEEESNEEESHTTRTRTTRANSSPREDNEESSNEPNELPTPEELGTGLEEPNEENEPPSEEETTSPIPRLNNETEEEGNYGESLEDGYLPTPEELGFDATKPLD